MSDVLEVSVNGEPRTVRDGTTVAELVRELTGSTQPRGIAVALDREVLPRSAWHDTTVERGVSIEVVAAVAGG